MKKVNFISRQFFVIVCLLTLFISIFYLNHPTFAESDESSKTPTTTSLTDQLFNNLKINAKVKVSPKFQENDIIFYNPNGGSNCSSGLGIISGNCGGDITSTITSERQDEVIRKYGEIAIKLQIEYGVPWEIPFGQMRMESTLGTAGIAKKVAEKGYYNWMGKKYKEDGLYNMAEPYRGGKTDWSMYSSIGNMIAGWSVDYMRNGYYDKAFQYLDKNNYDIKKWFFTMIKVYCPLSDKCTPHEQYWATVNSVVQRADQIGKELGWPTSAELAKQENIEIGGKYPVKGDIKSQLNAAPHSLSVDCSPIKNSTDSLANSSNTTKTTTETNSSTTTTNSITSTTPPSSETPSATPSTTPSTTSSGNGKIVVNTTWKDGWITSGIDGYVKEDAYAFAASKGTTVGSAPRGDYDTTMNGKIGPNKITLHNTEGGNQNGSQGLILYDLNHFYPPHFTVDLKQHKVYQHFSINKPSDSIRTYDASAGIQIEVIGFSTIKSVNHPWYLLNTNIFKADDWLYLAKLLVAISTETKIPLTSSLSWKGVPPRLSAEEFKKYEGVLAHMHAPLPNDHNDTNDIWHFVENELKRIDGVASTSSGSNSTHGNSNCGGRQSIDPSNMTNYLQCDPQWGLSPFGSSTICNAGCGPTSFASLATMLLGQQILPTETAKVAGDAGMYVRGVGSSHLVTQTLASHYGLQYEKIPTPANASQAIEIMNKYLDEGWTLHISGKGTAPFSANGHYIAVRGKSSDGKWLLFNSAGAGKDPNNLIMDPQTIVSAGLWLNNINAVKR